MSQLKNKKKTHISANTKELSDSILLIRLLLKCGTYLQREGTRIVSKYGLKQQQFVVLNEIVRKGPINQKNLIGELLFEKSNISKIVKILTKLDLIQVEYPESDRRVTILTYTSQGFIVWENCMFIFDEWSTSFTSTLTQKELSRSIHILKKLPEIYNP